VGPLKAKWSKSCPPPTVDMTREQRHEMSCIPLMEYIFATEVLAILETTKAAIEPS